MLMTAHETLIQAFASALCLPASRDLESAEYRRIAQWDSLAHMRLVAEIEKTFDIMLDTEDVIGMSSFRKALDILAKHGVDIT
jgi:acyl carrier protein